MTQNKNTDEREYLKKTDPSTWTAYGDPLKNDGESNMKGDDTKNTSPMIEKAQQDGNIVKKE